jgi:hypothetical protein
MPRQGRFLPALPGQQGGDRRALRTQNPRYWVDARPGKSSTGSAALRTSHGYTDEILMDRHEYSQARPAAATFA